jgi:hypothetical protein
MSWLASIMSTPGKLIGGIVSAITPGRATASPDPSPRKLSFGSSTETKDDDGGIEAHFGAHFTLETVDYREKSPLSRETRDSFPTKETRRKSRASGRKKKSAKQKAAVPLKRRKERAMRKATPQKKKKRKSPGNVSPTKLKRVKREPVRRNLRRSSRRGQKAGFYSQGRLEACAWRGRGTRSEPIEFDDR